MHVYRCVSMHILKIGDKMLLYFDSISNSAAATSMREVIQEVNIDPPSQSDFFFKQVTKK